MQPKKAVIIGSGIAGLAASIRLVAQGYNVHVYEKSEKPGGKLGFFQKKDTSLIQALVYLHSLIN
jgi:phytoene dehydrogenase-like protein